MIWISAEDVIRIHRCVIEGSGGLDGVRDQNGLEGAIFAPMQTFDGQELYPSDIEKIARLGFGLASNHAFVDGNKRIGAMMTQLLLKWNGYDLVLCPGELADMFIAIADGSANETDLLDWIHVHLHMSGHRTGGKCVK